MVSQDKHLFAQLAPAERDSYLATRRQQREQQRGVRREKTRLRVVRTAEYHAKALAARRHKYRSRMPAGWVDPLRREAGVAEVEALGGR